MAISNIQLEQENHERDADFKKAMHGKTAEATGGFAAMMGKNHEAQSAAVDEYFKFWDNKGAGVESEQDMKVCPINRQLPQSSPLTSLGPHCQLRHPHQALLQPRHGSL